MPSPNPQLPKRTSGLELPSRYLFSSETDPSKLTLDQSLGTQNGTLSKTSLLTLSDGPSDAQGDDKPKKKKTEKLDFDAWRSCGTSSGVWRLNFCSAVPRGSNRPTQAMPCMSGIQKAKDNAVCAHLTINCWDCNRRLRHIGLEIRWWSDGNLQQELSQESSRKKTKMRGPHDLYFGFILAGKLCLASRRSGRQLSEDFFKTCCTLRSPQHTLHAADSQRCSQRREYTNVRTHASDLLGPIVDRRSFGHSRILSFDRHVGYPLSSEENRETLSV